MGLEDRNLRYIVFEPWQKNSKLVYIHISILPLSRRISLFFLKWCSQNCFLSGWLRASISLIGPSKPENSVICSVLFTPFFPLSVLDGRWFQMLWMQRLIQQFVQQSFFEWLNDETRDTGRSYALLP